ncbi:MAG: hypothetical protein HKN82_02710, partial [Akkermansiaceae bacterium]|nr:hypothetical protein [Akkermansiaceae bacterium]
PRERLIRSAFLRNYDNCKRLDVFSDTISRKALAEGQAPQIGAGPDAGESVRIRYIIDPAASPGAEKIIPNLVISPPGLRDGKTDEFGIAQAKNLAAALSQAGLIEHPARDRIIAHYERVASEPDPAVPDEAGKEAVPTP